jgi:L-threonylcarbamoyladenylate synthase
VEGAPPRDLEAACREAARLLEAGAIVAHPTETVYGLAVDPWSEAAVGGLVRLKGREEGRGLILIAAEVDEVARLAAAPAPDALRAIAAAFWPGPLTVVLRPSGLAPRPALGPAGGLALRCTSDPVARALVRAFGRPVTSTSANLSGRPAAATAAEAAALGAGLALVLDGGARRSPAPSTLVDLTGAAPVVLREGAVPRAAVDRALGRA